MKSWVADVTIQSQGGDVSPERAIELVFNGDIFHRNAAAVNGLSQHRGWQWTLVGHLFGQIAALSAVYWEMAQGIGAVLESADLLPPHYVAPLL